MKVAINQSNYLPWKGYFDLMHDVDLFLFYDDVQFTTRDWRNRNRIKTAQGLQWLTVPVGDDTSRRICDVTMTDARWQQKHWRALRHAYGRAPHFRAFEPFLAEVYLDRTWSHLSELNQYLIERIARDYLDIGTDIQHASRFNLVSRKQDRILDLLRAVGATVYHSGPAGRAYLEPDRFAEAGIELVWKDYSGYPAYPQAHPPFEHAVSILDLLFHVGPDAQRFVWGWRSAPTCLPA